ncbi:MAG TPA: acetoacetate decarboxylase family protein [Acidimicrobiales bacterium]|nr:acetoacetate decarboxylase family protein [Acidimicrobiales bacterium]
MPLFGSLDTGGIAGVPVMADLHTDPLTIERADSLHLLHEIESAPMLDLIPPALHPTVPPTVSVWGWRCQGTEIGDFTVVQVRIGCRAGVRPRGYLLACYVDDDAAADALSARWGFRRDPGTPKLETMHHQTVVTVEREGTTIIDAALESPESISGGDVQYVAGMHLAETPSGPRLVQVDPEFTFHRADRGKPRLHVFDAAAVGDERIVPSWPVSSSFAITDITLPALRYVCRVDVPAMAGTEPVR